MLLMAELEDGGEEWHISRTQIERASLHNTIRAYNYPYDYLVTVCTLLS